MSEEMVRRIEFGADGIRGIADEWPLTPEVVRQIGGALGQFARRDSENGAAPPHVMLGRDTRPSGKELADGLKEGLLSQGVHVMDLGIMTTPGVAYLTRHKKAALGIVVSASHNPLNHNGIKLIGPDGLRLREENEIEDLINGFVTGTLKSSLSRGRETNEKDLVDLYIREQVELCPFKSLAGLRLVLDCANGALAEIAPQAFERLGAQVVNHSNGRKINESCGSEYASQHPQYLIEIVRENNADYGLAFDGDGDRLVIVDRDGRLYNGDDFLFALATYFYDQDKLRGETVVTTDMANTGLKKALLKRGIRLVFTEHGDKNLEKEIWENNYLLGSELVGNVIINDGHHAAADPLYAGLILCGIMNHQHVKLHELVADLHKHPQVLASVHLASTPPFEQVIPLQRQRENSKGILGEDARILMWYSSTERGLFKVMVEGSHNNSLSEVRNQAEAICEAVQRVTGPGTQKPKVFDLSQGTKQVLA